jgi:EAL domain-containing protein (putative c-di-GMP-specific phosphodiesterase class I)
MNALTQRIRRMLEEETSRLERLRLSLHTDPVSGLFNREHFLARVDAVLLREDADAQGAFAILRLVDLQELNRAHGWSVVDAFVDRFGSALDRMAPPGTEWFAGRLNGSEFGLFAPMQLDPAALAERILETLAMVARELGLESAYRVAVGATDYHHQDRVGDVLARADAALTGASRGGAVVEIIPSVRTAVHLAQPLEMAAWRMRFDAALVPGRLKLHGYPVVTGSGELLHRECVARLQVQDGEDWLHAREFLPWLARLGEVARLDEMVLELALDSMHEAFGELCINLSGQALDDRDALGRIAKRLEAAGERARRLWIEVPEFGVFQNTERFRALCGLVAPLGCRIGIEHVGHQIARIGEFHDLGLDYLKIDASFVRGVDANQANQIYLRGVALIARSIGLRVIGEGVETEGELRMLIELGFDGATGPAITLRQVAQDRSV